MIWIKLYIWYKYNARDSATSLIQMLADGKKIFQFNKIKFKSQKMIIFKIKTD